MEEEHQLNLEGLKKLNYYLSLVVEKDASDLHIIEGVPPTLRIDGRLVPIEGEKPLKAKEAEELSLAGLSPSQIDKLRKNKDIDLSYNLEGKARFRVNVYYQKGYISSAWRLIPSKIRTIEELNLPEILHKLVMYQQGFFLVVGPAGHGKTTAMAALVDEINHKREDHIITIEDPIEYIFKPDKCLIDQREVGQDAVSFAHALRAALRQDPDVIMIGEMRDRETIQAALTAAETGHLVFATLHTNDAAQTIDRIVDSFPPHQQNQIRYQLAATLIAILSRRLISRKEGGVVNAVELLIANSAVKNLIRENKIYQIPTVIETSIDEGMIPLNRSLGELVKKGEISLTDALNYSNNPAELNLLVEKDEV